MIHPIWTVAGVTMLLALGSCGRRAAPETQSAADSIAQFRVAHRPPQAKDIVEATIASGSVELSVSPSCKSVGTEPGDNTIAQYVAGFLALLSKSSGKNWIDTSTEAGTSSGREPVWICQLTVRHVDGDDRWGWGVRFQVRQRDGLVLRDSFECIGAG